MPVIPVYVISLARAPERRATIVAHLQALNVAYELVDAVDGQTIPPDQRKAMQAQDVDYHPGVLGCYLSHMEVYRRFLAADAPVALVLEDDARLNPAFAPALREGLKSLDFDYCLLDFQEFNEDGHVFYNRRDRIEIFPGFMACATHEGPGSTHAYLITREAAVRRLDHELPIARPVDIYSTLPYRPRFRALVPRRGAGVSEDSLRSFTSGRDHAGRLSFRKLRQVPGYYELKDAVNPRFWRLRREAARLARQGALPAGGQWRPLPTGRRIFL